MGSVLGVGAAAFGTESDKVVQQAHETEKPRHIAAQGLRVGYRLGTATPTDRNLHKESSAVNRFLTHSKPSVISLRASMFRAAATTWARSI